MTEAEEASRPPVGTVLIAEDDPDFRRLLARRASRMGLQVVEAEDGKEAIDALRGHAFDALIIDLYMPEHNGLEVVEAARKLDPDIQALVLTGSATVESAIEALRAGVYDYLTKPFDSMASFELALTRALERRYLLSENKRLFEEVQRLAVTDPLTGLYNRHKLQETLAMEIERAHRYGRPLSIIIIDVDELKAINDEFGHSAGDAALRSVGQAIRRCVRKVDVPTRFGGDEFLIVLPEADEEEAAKVARRVLEEIGKQGFDQGRLSVSIGVGQWNEEYATAEAFIQAVDAAMYAAKRAGGDRHFSLASEAGE